MAEAQPTVLDDVKSFADLGVDEQIVEALAESGINAPFPIQELTLPLALTGADLIGQARTGTGKTLAFGIPLLQRSDIGSTRPHALVIVPTRELCVQVRDDLAEAGAVKGARVVALYGGKRLDEQAQALAEGVQVVVGTPGRLLDFLNRRTLDLSEVRTLVLDEADEMLDLGFLPDVERLLEACPEDRQTLLFSATMPSAVVALARRYMRKPTFLRADVEEVHIGPRTEQHFLSVHRLDKPAVLIRILQSPGRGRSVVFTSTKRMADMLTEDLRNAGVAAAAIHSDLRQDARERSLARFRTGKVEVLVATEVAARGLDITDVTHVVNYDCPDDEKMYLHRIGRTARAGAAGVAVTLAMWNELARLEMIKKALDIDVPTHEVFSTSPLLDELFGIPARPSGQTAEALPAEEQPAAKGSTARREPRRRSGRTPRGQEKMAPQASAPQASAPESGAPKSRTSETVAPETRPETPAETRAETPAETPAAPHVAEASEGPEAGTEGAPEARPRTRRRVRVERKPEPVQETPKEATEQRGREADERDPGADEPEQRVRVRRRTRGEAATARAGRAEAGEGRERRRPRAETARRGAADTTKGSTDRGSTDRGSTDRGSTDEPRQVGREAGGTPRERRGRGQQARASARTGKRKDTARERGRQGVRQPSPQPAVDIEAARGAGNPRLTRPLDVAYVP